MNFASLTYVRIFVVFILIYFIDYVILCTTEPGFFFNN